ncbi:hypothetical protein [Lacihabitans sp. LS3-19]|nr:hypothetical protein [Lacihabitans sp. LS3-19]
MPTFANIHSNFGQPGGLSSLAFWVSTPTQKSSNNDSIPAAK